MTSTADGADRDALVLAMLRAVRDFGDAHDRMSGGLKHGMRMNATDLAALRLLIMREDSGRPVNPAEIARHLRISTASTTKLLDRLTASGHVRREPHPSDRRGRVVVLTDASRAEFFQRYGPQLAAIRAAMAGFSDAELEAGERLLRAISAAIDPPPQG
jgi:DNA-binding MarR family transcriptional regulator